MSLETSVYIDCIHKLYFMLTIYYIILQTHNLMTEHLARNARKQPSFVIRIDAELPVWVTKFS